METYTTQELLEVLGLGQKARCIEGRYKDRIITSWGNNYTWGPKNYVELDRPLLECKWQLVTLKGERS